MTNAGNAGNADAPTRRRKLPTPPHRLKLRRLRRASREATSADRFRLLFAVGDCNARRDPSLSVIGSSLSKEVL
jgi:hypothetical protein